MIFNADDKSFLKINVSGNIYEYKINNKGNKQGNNKREIWVGTDSPKIKIKELKNGKMELYMKVILKIILKKEKEYFIIIMGIEKWEII